MHGLKGERTLMRIHVEERDRHRGRPLYEVIVDLLRRRRIAGATVLQGTMGFGAGAHLHTEHAFALKEDLPIVIEAVDTDEQILAILPELDALIGGGLITLERVRVIMYRKKGSAQPADHATSTDITGNWRITR